MYVEEFICLPHVVPISTRLSGFLPQSKDNRLDLEFLKYLYCMARACSVVLPGLIAYAARFGG